MAENYFDPEEPVAGDTRSADASKSGVRRAWDEFTSRPENNAALLQFGIALMQPRSQSQTGIGHFANAIGEAGEASSRNIGAQQQEAARQAKIAEDTSTAEYRRAQGQAALQNAAAYGRQVDNLAPGGAGAKSAASRLLAQQRAYAQWLKAPVDTVGLTADPILQAIQQKFPNIKSKADIINNPQISQQVFKLFGAQFDEAAASEVPPAAASATPPPAAPQPAAPGAAAAPPPGVPPGARYYQGRWYTRGPNGEAVPVPGY